MSMGSYWPIECKCKCELFTCVAGQGLAGTGFCFRWGAWWMQCCPAFEDEEEFMDKWQRESEGRL